MSLLLLRLCPTPQDLLGWAGWPLTQPGDSPPRVSARGVPRAGFSAARCSHSHTHFLTQLKDHLVQGFSFSLEGITSNEK